MSSSAALLSSKLEAWGATVLSNCSASGQSESFHKTGDLQAVEMIKTCSVFIALMNEDWAMSHECKDEINVAKRLQLTSHARGHTAPGSTQLPVIIPVAFSDLRTQVHSHLESLFRSVRLIHHDQSTLDAGRIDGTVADIVQYIESAGITVSREVDPVGEKRRRELFEANSFNGSETDCVKEVVESTTVNQQYDETPQYGTYQTIRIPSTLPVGTKYFGISSLSGIMVDGHTYENWQSCEITITGGNSK